MIGIGIRRLLRGGDRDFHIEQAYRWLTPKPLVNKAPTLTPSARLGLSHSLGAQAPARGGTESVARAGCVGRASVAALRRRVPNPLRDLADGARGRTTRWMPTTSATRRISTRARGTIAPRPRASFASPTSRRTSPRVTSRRSSRTTVESEPRIAPRPARPRPASVAPRPPPTPPASASSSSTPETTPKTPSGTCTAAISTAPSSTSPSRTSAPFTWHDAAAYPIEPSLDPRAEKVPVAHPTPTPFPEPRFSARPADETAAAAITTRPTCTREDADATTPRGEAIRRVGAPSGPGRMRRDIRRECETRTEMDTAVGTGAETVEGALRRVELRVLEVARGAPFSDGIAAAGAHRGTTIGVDFAVVGVGAEAEAGEGAGVGAGTRAGAEAGAGVGTKVEAEAEAGGVPVGVDACGRGRGRGLGRRRGRRVALGDVGGGEDEEGRRVHLPRTRISGDGDRTGAASRLGGRG